MATTQNNQPNSTIRYGTLKATIWANPSKDGQSVRYSVNYSKGYKTESGEWKETQSLGEIDNLKLSYLVDKVTERFLELKQLEKQE